MDRAALVGEIETRHIASGFPRVQLSLLIGVAGAAAFLTSVLLLRAGIDAMWVRYPLAVLGGYVTLLALLRLWIAWQRGWRPDLDADDWEAGDQTAQAPFPSFGGGGGTRWQQSSSRPSTSEWSMGDVSIDLDDAWWLVVAGLLALGGALAIGYVVYIAPVLLAEVALDAALVTAVYRRLRPHDAQHWAIGVLRQTWVPAVLLVLFLAGMGAALQQVAPEARSIGGVVAHLRR